MLEVTVKILEEVYDESERRKEKTKPVETLKNKLEHFLKRSFFS